MTKISSEVAAYFPYLEVRPFQDDFINTVSEAVECGQSALVEGSNGLGKTIATLAACLPLAKQKNLKILYAARTHRQHDRVIEELKAISKKKQVSGISIRGRHEMCTNQFVTRYAGDAKSVMEACEMLKAARKCEYYENSKKRAEEYVDVQQQISSHAYKASEIQRICRRTGFCPYELTKSSLADANLIAMSYLYVFDPEIRKVFLKNLEIGLHEIILIVDEAHNLPETAVDIAGSRLSLFALGRAGLEAKNFGYDDIASFVATVKCEIEKATGKVDKEAIVPSSFLSEVIQEKEGIDDPSTFLQRLNTVGYRIKRSLLADGKYPRSFVHGFGEFLTRWIETADDQSFIHVISKYMSKQGLATARLEIIALDPSKITAPVFSETYSNIIISGTLQPMDAFVQIVKLPENTAQTVIPSPFPKEHILPLICRGVTTAMEKRTSQMYSKIISRTKEVVENTPANTGVFAASFGVLQAMLENGLGNEIDKPLFHERRGMSSKDNEYMVAQFKANAGQGGAVLLGVLGGRSAEGVDFPGDEMNSVVIVGVPYAEPTPKVKAQIGYFEECFPNRGREYAYVIPAMKKASQAAGRPIRTLEDKASMVFLDDRFSNAYCQRFLPLWIRTNLKTLPDKEGIIAQELTCFFKKAY